MSEEDLEAAAVALDDAYEEAERLCGRSVEVDKTADGSYIVIWLNAEQKPPPKGATVKEALDGFIDHMKKLNPKEVHDAP